MNKKYIPFMNFIQYYMRILGNLIFVMDESLQKNTLFI
jgi:hypothetical protein